MLTDEQLREYQETGLLVVEDVLTAAEVEKTRDAFHRHLQSHLHINHDAVLSHTESPPLHRIKSPVSRIFYPGWKLLDVHLHPRVVTLATELLRKTYGIANLDIFSHPVGDFPIRCERRVALACIWTGIPSTPIFSRVPA
jgi:hypothetical protein